MVMMIEPQEAPRREGPQPLAPLGVLTSLFARLRAEHIRYCHWKSNQHLQATMVGATDVDLLVDRKAAQQLAGILTATTTFKRFVAKAGLGYPGIEDYVGFDADTGTLTHLHLHYQLTLGERFLKGHRLPWEDVVLATRVLDEEHEIYVADPNVELLLLVVRAALKLRMRDFVLMGAGRSYFRGSMLRELRWLAARTHPERLLELAGGLVGPKAARLLLEMIAVPAPSIRQLRAFRRSAEPSLREYRMYGTGGALRRMWGREWSRIWWKGRNWLVRGPSKSTRILPQGGLAVAFVGADGAGKTTVSRAVAEWLSQDAAVVWVYGGTGSGSGSLARRLLQRVAALVRRAPRARPSPPARRPRAESAAREPSGLRALGRLLWVFALARERRKRALQIRRARSLGMIVISDRCPQSQFPGLNDGPRHSHWLAQGFGLRRAAAKRELAAIRLAELVAPDVVVRLHVPMDVAARRKPDTPLDQLRRKVDIVARLEFPPATRVVQIDATQSLAQVVLQVKRAIWECL
jgi:thymidylate kinase